MLATTLASMAEHGNATHAAGSSGFGAVISPSSCEELGWCESPHDWDSEAVCAAGLNGCRSLSWADAADVCKLAGARLCTRTELANDEEARGVCDAVGVGDLEHAWSSSVCGQDPVRYFASVSNGGQRLTDSICLDANGTDAHVRCCADTRKPLPLCYGAKGETPVAPPSPSRDVAKDGADDVAKDGADDEQAWLLVTVLACAVAVASLSIGAALVLLKRRTARLGARGSNGASLELATLPGVVTGTAVSVVGAPQAVPRAVPVMTGTVVQVEVPSNVASGQVGG